MEDIMEININLTLDDENLECLKCKINENEHILSFTKEDQTNQRNFFMDILRIAINKSVKFNLILDEEVKNQIVIDASKDYVTSLNGEIASVIKEIKKQDIS